MTTGSSLTSTPPLSSSRHTPLARGKAVAPPKSRPNVSRAASTQCAWSIAVVPSRSTLGTNRTTRTALRLACRPEGSMTTSLTINIDRRAARCKSGSLRSPVANDIAHQPAGETVYLERPKCRPGLVQRLVLRSAACRRACVPGTLLGPAYVDQRLGGHARHVCGASSSSACSARWFDWDGERFRPFRLVTAARRLFCPVAVDPVGTAGAFADSLRPASL